MKRTKILLWVFLSTILFAGSTGLHAQPCNTAPNLCNNPFEICSADTSFCIEDINGSGSFEEWYILDINITPFDFDITFVASNSTIEQVHIWGPFTSHSDSCEYMENDALPTIVSDTLSSSTYALSETPFPGPGKYIIRIRHSYSGGDPFTAYLEFHRTGYYNSVCAPFTCPSVSVSPSSSTICLGSCVSLTASGSTEYTWAPAAGLSATTGSVVTACPSVTTTYTVTETTCNNTATALVTVSNPIALTVGEKNDFCWVKTGGGTPNDNGYDIVVDAAGNSYITGALRGTGIIDNVILQSAGGADGFIVKYNSAGTLQWAARFGSADDDIGLSLDLDDNGNIYVSGYFSGTATFGNNTVTTSGTWDAFLAKYDANGNNIWVNRMGGTSLDYSFHMGVDDNKNIYAVGTTWSDPFVIGTHTITSYGSNDIFVAKFDSVGSVQWVSHCGGTSAESANSLSIDETGNVYIAGVFFSGTATFGSVVLTKVASSDVFVAKFNSAGTVQWAKNAGNSGNNEALAVGCDRKGGVFVTGYYTGTTITFGSTTLTNTSSNRDVFLAKYNTSTGNAVWAKDGGGTGEDAAQGVSFDTYGEPIISGYFTGTASFGGNTITSTGGEDIFISKYDVNGNEKWTKAANGTTANNDEAFGCFIDAENNVFVTGHFHTSAHFDSKTVASTGEKDYFLAKICSSEDHVNICKDSSVTLYASGGGTYTWYPSAGLSSTTGYKVIASPSVTTTYTVIASGNGCNDTSNIVVLVNNCSIACFNCITSFAPEPNKKYIINAWAKEQNAVATKTSYTFPELYVEFPSISVTFGPFKPSGEIIDGWQRIEGEFVVPDTATDIKIKLVSTSGNVYFDDIRVHPFDGMMKSYVYDPVTLRLTAELDERNYATLFEYDEEGKRTRIKKETERGIMTIEESKSNRKKR